MEIISFETENCTIFYIPYSMKKVSVVDSENMEPNKNDKRGGNKRRLHASVIREDRPRQYLNLILSKVNSLAIRSTV